jgi:hypothetical protein
MKLGKQLALVSLALAAAVPACAQQFRSGSVSPALQLLAIPEVRKELKLSDTQTAQLTEVQTGFKGGFLAMIRGAKDLPPTDRRKKFDSFRSDLDRKLVLMLDAGQRKRLHELELQHDGPRVLLKPDVRAELGLSGEQSNKLMAVTREESTSIRGLYQTISKTPTPAEQTDALTKVKLIQTKTDNAIYEVLTNDQKSKFRVMQGEPFKFPERRSAPVTVSTPRPAGKPGLKPATAPKPTAATKPAPKPAPAVKPK